MSNVIENAADAIDRLISHLNTLLRYIASGFVGLLFIVGANLKFNPFLEVCDKNLRISLILVSVVLSGIIIYAVHTGVLVQLMWYRGIVWVYKIRRHSWIPLQHAGNQVKELMYNLATQRWLRRASQESDTLTLQREMDRWAAMLNFLYCSSYPIILVSIWVFKEYGLSPKFWYILGTGIFILLCALISDYRLTGREFRTWKEHPQGKS